MKAASPAPGDPSVSLLEKKKERNLLGYGRGGDKGQKNSRTGRGGRQKINRFRLESARGKKKRENCRALDDGGWRKGEKKGKPVRRGARSYDRKRTGLTDNPEKRREPSRAKKTAVGLKSHRSKKKRSLAGLPGKKERGRSSSYDSGWGEGKKEKNPRTESPTPCFPWKGRIGADTRGGGKERTSGESGEKGHRVLGGPEWPQESRRLKRGKKKASKSARPKKKGKKGSGDGN